MKKGLIFLFLALAITACSSNNSNQGSAQTQASASASSTELASESASPISSSPVDEVKPHSVGEKFTFGEWEVSVDKFQFTEEIKDGDMFVYDADDGNQFLFLTLTLTNKGTDSEEFASMIGGNEIIAVYNGKYEYNLSSTTLDSELVGKSIQPLASFTGTLVIQMPKTAIDAREGINLKLANDQVTEFVKLK